MKTFKMVGGTATFDVHLSRWGMLSYGFKMICGGCVGISVIKFDATPLDELVIKNPKNAHFLEGNGFEFTNKDEG